MAGGGRGGHVIFPHPDDEEAGHLLDDVGSTNANDDDIDDTPPPPPKNDGDAPRREGGRDDDAAVKLASRDAVATNATNAKNAIGPRGARDLCAGAETGCIVPRADNIIDYCIVRTLHKYLQISADICRYLVTPADIWSCRRYRHVI